jgi:hypothetical protein
MVAGMDRKQGAGNRSVQMADVAAQARETEAVLREIEAKVRAQNLGPASLPTGRSLTPPGDEATGRVRARAKVPTGS